MEVKVLSLKTSKGNQLTQFTLRFFINCIASVENHANLQYMIDLMAEYTLNIPKDLFKDRHKHPR